MKLLKSFYFKIFEKFVKFWFLKSYTLTSSLWDWCLNCQNGLQIWNYFSLQHSALLYRPRQILRNKINIYIYFFEIHDLRTPNLLSTKFIFVPTINGKVVNQFAWVPGRGSLQIWNKLENDLFGVVCPTHQPCQVILLSN